MKHLSITFLLLFLVSPFFSFGQQDPQFTHYMFNKQVINPAYSGSGKPNHFCATFLYHNQWTGFEGPNKDKGPVTQSFSIHSPIKSNLFQGAGLYLINDAQGFENTLSIYGTVALQKSLSFGKISAGLDLGVIQRGYDGEWKPVDQGDPGIPNTKVNNMLPDLGLGVYLKGSNYYLGASFKHLIGGKFDWETEADNSLSLHSYLTAGYYYPITGDIDVEPSVMLKMITAKLQMDFNANVWYKKKYWAGILYRYQDALSLLLGVEVLDKIRFGYSYDLTTSKLKGYSSGTHEIMLNYCFKIKKTTRVKPEISIKTPRYL